MERYLVYDSGCSICDQLAGVVRDAAGGKIEPISIRGEKAKALLDEAFPSGWGYAPYLVAVDGGRVRAWTGTASALHLTRLVGVRKALRIWNAARKSGVYLPPGGGLGEGPALSRRAFVKLAGGMAAAAATVGLVPSKAFGCEICRAGPYPGCGLRCYDRGCTIVTYCDPSSPGCAYLCRKCDCYDGRTGQFCGTYRRRCQSASYDCPSPGC